MAYYVLSLKDMLTAVGEEEARSILSTFSCPPNADVEDYIRHKAIPMAPQQVAPTQLVFTEYKGQKVLIGYFAIATKTLSVKRTALSNAYAKRIGKFATLDISSNTYHIAAQLIAQLGKNFTNGYDRLITGNDLLKLACDEIRKAQQIIGGKVVYLECEDHHKLVKFYEDNGFVVFGKREISRKDQELIGQPYLIQMLKYLG